MCEENSVQNNSVQKQEGKSKTMFFKGFFSYSPILSTSLNFTWNQEPEKDKQNFQLCNFIKLFHLNAEEWIAILLFQWIITANG